jgi:hypothetical protein
MKLWLYVRGERILEGPEHVRIKKGPLFCIIDFAGDGTAGEITYSGVQNGQQAKGHFSNLRQKIEYSVEAEQVHYLANASQIKCGETMISCDTFASADRWTREYFEHGIVLDLRDDFLFEWNEDPTDRVMKAFPKKLGTSPVPVRGRRNNKKTE